MSEFFIQVGQETVKQLQQLTLIAQRDPSTTGIVTTVALVVFAGVAGSALLFTAYKFTKAVNAQKQDDQSWFGAALTVITNQKTEIMRDIRGMFSKQDDSE